jgi:hypothetical protein
LVQCCIFLVSSHGAQFIFVPYEIPTAHETPEQE